MFGIQIGRCAATAKNVQKVDATNHNKGPHQHLLELNQLIDNNVGKPADVNPEHWKTLVAMRATKAAQVKLGHMRSI